MSKTLSRILSLLLALFFLPTFVLAENPEDYSYVKTLQPDVKFFEQIGGNVSSTIPKDTVLLFLDNGNPNSLFVHVQYNGVPGYVNKRLISSVSYDNAIEQNLSFAYTSPAPVKTTSPATKFFDFSYAEYAAHFAQCNYSISGIYSTSFSLDSADAASLLGYAFMSLGGITITYDPSSCRVLSVEFLSSSTALSNDDILSVAGMILALEYTPFDLQLYKNMLDKGFSKEELGTAPSTDSIYLAYDLSLALSSGITGQIKRTQNAVYSIKSSDGYHYIVASPL